MKNKANSTILLGRDLKSSSWKFTATLKILVEWLSHGKATFRIHDFVKEKYSYHKCSVKKQEVFRKEASGFKRWLFKTFQTNIWHQIHLSPKSAEPGHFYQLFLSSWSRTSLPFQYHPLLLLHNGLDLATLILKTPVFSRFYELSSLWVRTWIVVDGMWVWDPERL